MYYNYLYDNSKIAEIVYNELINANSNLEEFIFLFNKYISEKSIKLIPFSKELILDIYNFLYINNYKLNNEIFDFIVITLLQKNYIVKFISYSKNNYTSNYEYNLTINSFILNYNICKKYNIFYNLLQYYENLLNDINIKSCYKYKNNYLDNTIHNNTIDNNINI
tara:strand:- start:500 stop:994 length:495 start_codon:yes stop_codon:yes gene_type:complete